MITNDLILRIVSEYLQVSISEILKSDKLPDARNIENIKARQFCMYLAKKHIKIAKKKISDKRLGIYFGYRDHATVYHARKNAEKFIKFEPEYKMQIEECEKRIFNKTNKYDFVPQDVEISAENLSFQRQ